MDNFVRKFLKHRGFSNDVIKAVEEKTKKTTAEQEMEHRLLAEAMTKQMVNEMLPAFREHLKKQQQPPPERKIIIDEK